MDAVVVWAELGEAGEEETATARDQVVVEADEGDLARVTVIGEDRGVDRVLVAGATSIEAALRLAHAVERAAVTALGAAPVPVSVYAAAQRLGSPEPAGDAAVLTVRLPVPAGREHEWNRWYVEEHMPSLLEQVGPAIVSGTRYAPLGGETDYLVAYDFATLETMRDWVDGQGIQGKRSTYRERWGVVNRTRAFAPVR